ncbi:MAG TPA: hypothetical protein VN873_13060 [Candidatus Angelobacter sp.]|nr:hypothetical protein [Candidatus Angelobacter sp.]
MGTSTNRSLMVAAMILALCAAPKTRGNIPYLKQSGPSPLRFSPTLAEMTSFDLPALLIERASPTNTTESTETKSVESKTNSPAISSAPVLPPPATVPVTATAEPQNNSASGPSASDLLVVSPQMLTEFFKPDASGTNTATPVVTPAAPVGFTPPSVAPSSRATYNSP